MKAPNVPIQFDDLVAAMAVREAREQGRENPLEALDELPLEWVSQGGERIWKASQMHLVPGGDVQMRQRIRRTDYAEGVERFRAVGAGKIPNHTPGTGPFKDYQLLAPDQFFPRAEAWCIGDRERLTVLLESLRYVGKERKNGLGRVASIEIEPDQTALDGWCWRPLGEQRPGYVPVAMPPSPPYWNRARNRLMYAPLEGPESVMGGAS